MISVLGVSRADPRRHIKKVVTSVIFHLRLVQFVGMAMNKQDKTQRKAQKRK